MTDSRTDLLAALQTDAARRATPAPHVVEDDAGETTWELRVRLVNAWPRETLPAFDALRSELAPFGYTLSPLHPTASLHPPRMQTVLLRTEAGAQQAFAPLVFELIDTAGTLRASVRQFGGRLAPDFPPRTLPLTAPADPAALTGILRAYAICMLRPQPV